MSKIRTERLCKLLKIPLEKELTQQEKLERLIGMNPQLPIYYVMGESGEIVDTDCMGEIKAVNKEQTVKGKERIWRKVDLWYKVLEDVKGRERHSFKNVKDLEKLQRSLNWEEAIVVYLE